MIGSKGLLDATHKLPLLTTSVDQVCRDTTRYSLSVSNIIVTTSLGLLPLTSVSFRPHGPFLPQPTWDFTPSSSRALSLAAFSYLTAGSNLLEELVLILYEGVPRVLST